MSLSISGISISSITSAMHLCSSCARAPSSFPEEWNRHYITSVLYILLSQWMHTNYRHWYGYRNKYQKISWSSPSRPSLHETCVKSAWFQKCWFYSLRDSSSCDCVCGVLRPCARASAVRTRWAESTRSCCEWPWARIPNSERPCSLRAARAATSPSTTYCRYCTSTSPRVITYSTIYGHSFIKYD